jgi:hypothetical protein
MKIPKWLPVYGDLNFRGECPTETAEQIAFFNAVRKTKIGELAVHPKNEGLKKGGQFFMVAKDKALGMTPGASDIIIPGNPAFVCEMKRLDHTKCKWQPGQIEYLETAYDMGCFVCVALGHEAALKAFNDWVNRLCRNA